MVHVIAITTLNRLHPPNFEGMLSVLAGSVQGCFGVFGMYERFKSIKLHITWLLWVHEWLIMMSFSRYSPLD
jgi:hypothetical protein